jgi:nitronate monooxygenase
MESALYRPVCDLLGCAYPIVAAGMGGVARSELVAAVSAAGAFGFLGMVREPVARIRSEVEALRRRGFERFGVNLIPAATDRELLEAQLASCIALHVPVIGLFWDIPFTLVRRLRDAGIIVACQVGTLAEARSVEHAGAHIIIAKGVEAGGHVRGECPLDELVPDIAGQTTLPVLAAGGLVDGADLVTVLALGAQGAVFGTALVATEESFAHEYHKQRLVAAASEDTVLTDAFHINWPRDAKVRALANSVTRGERGDPSGKTRTVIGDDEGRPIYLFSTDSPLRSMTGDFEAMALYAGAGVGRINEVQPVAARIHAIAAQAAGLCGSGAAHGLGQQEFASPACSAHEMEDSYMGYATRDELLAALNELLEAERAGARVTLRMTKEVPNALKTTMVEVQQDEARWCGVLTKAIQQLQGTPSGKTGTFYEKAMAISDVAERLAFLNRGQGWVVRKLEGLLPRVRDDALHADLAAMLKSHRDNIELVTSHSQGEASGGTQ